MTQTILLCHCRDKPPIFMLDVPMIYSLQFHPKCTELCTLHASLITTNLCSSKSLAPHFLDKNWYSVVGRRQWHPTPVLLPGKFHGWKSMEGCSPWGCWGSDTTERLHFHFSLSCIGEGNDNPLQLGCCLCGHTESDMTEAT